MTTTPPVSDAAAVAALAGATVPVAQQTPMPTVTNSVVTNTPTPAVSLPAPVVAAASSWLNRIQNTSHATVAAASALIVGVEAIVQTLHQFNIDTNGADLKLVAAAGGVGMASKVIDSVSWSSILKMFGGSSVA